MAEEGFREGLKTIARKNGLDEETFFMRSRELIYDTGYVTGTGDEHAYWQAVRREFGVAASDAELRAEVLKRFVVRREMFAFAADLGRQGHTLALLTDQTDWLYVLDQENGMGMLAPFAFVFNSYDLHMSKRDPALFRYVEGALEVAAKDILFVDDTPENVRSAAKLGWTAILFLDSNAVQTELMSRLKND